MEYTHTQTHTYLESTQEGKISFRESILFAQLKLTQNKNFQCFDLHQMLFTLDRTDRRSKSQRVCSDVLFSLNTPVNFHLLECVFNAFLTTDFRLVDSLGMDVRC